VSLAAVLTGHAVLVIGVGPTRFSLRASESARAGSSPVSFTAKDAEVVERACPDPTRDVLKDRRDLPPLVYADAVEIPTSPAHIRPAAEGMGP